MNWNGCSGPFDGCGGSGPWPNGARIHKDMMTASGHSLQIVRRRKTLHVRNVPIAEVNATELADRWPRPCASARSLHRCKPSTTDGPVARRIDEQDSRGRRYSVGEPRTTAQVESGANGAIPYFPVLTHEIRCSGFIKFAVLETCFRCSARQGISRKSTDVTAETAARSRRVTGAFEKFADNYPV